jgi:alpha-beta hydrolase superfamily lysophospholipase
MVVICPPLAREHDASHPALRALAEALVVVGFSAVRFDYYGTGDSGGNGGEDDLVDSWLASIGAVVSYAREVGEQHVTLLGLRMGATLAARLAPELAPLAALVLWDPCPRGGAFVREQYLLQRLTLRVVGAGEVPEGWTEIPGGCFAPAVAERLKRIQLPTAGHVPTESPILVLTRAGDAPAPSVARLLDAPNVTHLEAPGQRDLLEVPPSDAVHRTETLDAIVSYLSAVAPADEVVVALPVPSHVLLQSSGGRSIAERAVRLGRNGLFGIVTEADDPKPLTVVFINAYFDHHLGPSRQWVELARRWALHGVRSLRFDTRGLGDSPYVRERPAMYSATLVEDALSAAETVSEGSSNVIFIGLCSGAWVAAVAGARLRARGVVLVNQIYWNKAGRSLDSHGNLRRDDDPIAFLQALNAVGVDVTLLLALEDLERLRLAAGADRLERLQAPVAEATGGALSIVPIDLLDHNVLTYSGRESLARHLNAVVLAALAPAAGRLLSGDAAAAHR